MFYHLLYPLHEHFAPFNVFRYITFRAAYALATALFIALFLGPPVIRRLRALKIGQKVRDDGPQSHLPKAGTPTMGGVLMVISIAVTTLLWGNLSNRNVWIALIATIWMGTVGFIDDYLRVVKNFRKGLLGRYKLAGQITLGIGVFAAVFFYPAHGLLDPAETNIPFLKRTVVDFGWLYLPFVILVITGASNAVNLADGLDGLAAGLAAFGAVALGGMCYITGHAKFSQYLQVPYIAGTGELAVFCAAIIGATLGFLWWNCHPADVFMGDTGSLSLGAALGTVAVLIKREFLLAIVCGVFVIEALSVMAQVLSFKIWGIRVLKMAPLHHHFELSGWKETRVVVRFWIAAALCALLALSTLKLQ
ncbi:MAG TPA: phospho-N-acetylmuramoyl-pentapeptide-transferase [Candidatus Omnitrophota bacterium]|nr:phospho-N-acetylmuramoyl-pentapeptide-transferase [Candidatus Eisenbacteria bacterium]HTM01250.1 phospho-N-acetylmuramoyl-pentapeptide-transferase [Candidatus Omnitrophota bacterium]